MNHSENINEIAKALSIAQGKFKPLIKNKKANYGLFADLSACFDCTVEALSAVGIARFQSIRNGNLVTKLLHPSGQWLESEVPLVGDLSTMQKLGSAITYGRRYGYSAAVGISAEDDDDGEAAKAHDEQPDPKNSPHIANPQTISQAQLGLLHGTCTKRKWTPDQLKEYLKSAYNLDSSKDIPRMKFNIILGVIQNFDHEKAMEELNK